MFSQQLAEWLNNTNHVKATCYKGLANVNKGHIGTTGTRQDRTGQDTPFHLCCPVPESDFKIGRCPCPVLTCMTHPICYCVQRLGTIHKINPPTAIIISSVPVWFINVMSHLRNRITVCLWSIVVNNKWSLIMARSTSANRPPSH